MGKAIAVHSHKGGTGKTIVSSCLATILARKGHNVCLLDLDMRAPSMNVLFKEVPKFWLNDCLEGVAKLSESLMDFSQKVNSKGKLWVGLSNPSSGAIKKMLSKSDRDEAKILQKLLIAKEELLEKNKFDFLISDTTPGINISAVNAIATSDLVILVMKMDDFDIEGTKELITGVLDALSKPTSIIINRVISQEIFTKGIEWKVDEGEGVKLSQHIDQVLGKPVIGVIPCYCDITLTSGKHLYPVDMPDHPIVKILEGISAKLVS